MYITFCQSLNKPNNYNAMSAFELRPLYRVSFHVLPSFVLIFFFEQPFFASILTLLCCLIRRIITLLDARKAGILR